MGSRRSQMVVLRSLLLLGLWLGPSNAALAAGSGAEEGPQELTDARSLVRDAITYLRAEQEHARDQFVKESTRCENEQARLTSLEEALQRRGGQQASVDAGVLRLEVDALKASVQHHERRVAEMERELKAMRKTERATSSLASEHSGQSEDAEEAERSLRLAREVVGSHLPADAPKPLRSPNARALLSLEGVAFDGHHTEAAAELLQAAQDSAEGLDAASSSAKRAVRRDAGESKKLASSVVHEAELALEEERENLRSQKRMLAAVDDDASVQLRQIQSVQREETAVVQLNHMLKTTCDFKARVYEDLASKRTSMIDLLLRTEETLDGSSIVEVARLLENEEAELEKTSARARRELARMGDEMDRVARRSSLARKEMASDSMHATGATGGAGMAALGELERRAEQLEEDMTRGKPEKDCPPAATGEAGPKQGEERELTEKEERLQRGLFDVFEGHASAATSQSKPSPAQEEGESSEEAPKAPKRSEEAPKSSEEAPKASKRSEEAPKRSEEAPKRSEEAPKRSEGVKAVRGQAQRRSSAPPRAAARRAPAAREPARPAARVVAAPKQPQAPKDLTLPEASRAVQQDQKALEEKRASLAQFEEGLEHLHKSVEAAHNRTRELQVEMSARAEKLEQNQKRLQAARERKMQLAAAAKAKEEALQKARDEAEKKAQRATRLRELYARLSGVLRQDIEAEQAQDGESALLETSEVSYEALRQEAAELGVVLPAEKEQALTTLKSVVDKEDAEVSKAEVAVESMQQEAEAAAREAQMVSAEMQELGEEAKTLMHDLEGLRQEHESTSKELTSVSTQYEETLRKVQGVEAEVSQLEVSYADESEALERAFEDAEEGVDFGATGFTGATGAATETAQEEGPTGAHDGPEPRKATAASGSAQPSDPEPAQREAATGPSSSAATGSAKPKEAVERVWPKMSREEMKAVLKEHDAITQRMLRTSVPAYAEELSQQLLAMQDRYRTALHWETVHIPEEPAAPEAPKASTGAAGVASTGATGAADAASSTAAVAKEVAEVAEEPTHQTPQSASKQSLHYSVTEARSMPCARAEACAERRRAAVRSIVAATKAGMLGFDAATGGETGATGATGAPQSGMEAVDDALERLHEKLAAARTFAAAAASSNQGSVSGGDAELATNGPSEPHKAQAAAHEDFHALPTMATGGAHFERRVDKEIERVEQAVEDGTLPELIYDEEEAAATGSTGATGAVTTRSVTSGTVTSGAGSVSMDDAGPSEATEEEETVDAAGAEEAAEEKAAEEEAAEEEAKEEAVKEEAAKEEAAKEEAAEEEAEEASATGATGATGTASGSVSMSTYAEQMDREVKAATRKEAKELAFERALTGKLRFAGDADETDLVAHTGDDSALEVGHEDDCSYCESTWIAREDGALCLRSNDHRCLVAGHEGDDVRIESEISISQTSLRGNLNSLDGGVRPTHWRPLDDGRIVVAERPSLCLTLGAGDAVTLEAASAKRLDQQMWLFDTTRE